MLIESRTIGIIPLAALFILFDAAVFNPKHPETRTNLIFLDIAAGYFSRLEYASGGYFRSSFLGEFAAMAKSFIRAHEQSKQPGSKTPIQPEKTSRPEDSSRDNFGSTLGQEDVSDSPPLQGFSCTRSLILCRLVSQRRCLHLNLMVL